MLSLFKPLSFGLLKEPVNFAVFSLTSTQMNPPPFCLDEFSRALCGLCFHMVCISTWILMGSCQGEVQTPCYGKHCSYCVPTHPSLQSPCKNYSDSLTYKSVMASFKKFQELSFIFRIKADIHKMLKKKKKKKKKHI